MSVPVLDSSAPSEDIARHFSTSGCLLLKNAIDKALIDSLNEKITFLVKAQLSCVQIDEETNNFDLNALYNRLCRLNRVRAGYVYNAIQWLPEYLEIICASQLPVLARALLGSENIISPPHLAWVRIDRRHETQNLFPWHQDYTYNLASRPTLTAWMPLQKVTAEMGPIVVVPRSHLRHHRVEVSGLDRYAKIIDIDLENLEEKACTISPNVGDVLIFHDLLLHRGGINQTDQARWVLNARWATLEDPEYSMNGWQFRQERSFKMLEERHPNKLKYVLKKQEVEESP